MSKSRTAIVNYIGRTIVELPIISQTSLGFNLQVGGDNLSPVTEWFPFKCNAGTCEEVVKEEEDDLVM